MSTFDPYVSNLPGFTAVMVELFNHYVGTPPALQHLMFTLDANGARVDVVEVKGKKRTWLCPRGVANASFFENATALMDIYRPGAQQYRVELGAKMVPIVERTSHMMSLPALDMWRAVLSEIPPGAFIESDFGQGSVSKGYADPDPDEIEADAVWQARKVARLLAQHPDSRICILLPDGTEVDMASVEFRMGAVVVKSVNSLKFELTRPVS